MDNRQSLDDIVEEFLWLQFLAVGTMVGVFIEEMILQLLGEWSLGA